MLNVLGQLIMLHLMSMKYQMYVIFICYMSCLLHPEQFAPPRRTVGGGREHLKLFKNHF